MLSVLCCLADGAAAGNVAPAPPPTVSLIASPQPTPASAAPPVALPAGQHKRKARDGLEKELQAAVAALKKLQAPPQRKSARRAGDELSLVDATAKMGERAKRKCVLCVCVCEPE